MKRMIFITPVLLFFYNLVLAQQVSKQEKGFFNITELGLFFGGDDTRTQVAPTTFVSTYDNVHVRSLRNISGAFITNHISLGLGVGLDGIQVKAGPFYNTLLVFGDARYYFKADDSGFFLFGDLGRAVPVSSSFEKGLMINGGGGIKFMVSDHTAMNASLGYNEQKIDAAPGDRHRIPSLSFKAGIMF